MDERKGEIETIFSVAATSRPVNESITALEDQVTINKLFAAEVVDQIINPSIKKELHTMSKWRLRWHSYSNGFEFGSTLLMGAAIILSTSAGFYNYQFLSFLSGSASAVALVLQRFSKYAQHESGENTLLLNRILVTLGIKGVPDISNVSQGETHV